MYWMTGEHGTHVCYDDGDMKRHLSLGWTLLNEGPRPIYPVKVTPITQVAAETASAVAVSPDADILESPVVGIIPQLEGMTRAQLEALRAREQEAAKPRAGLLKILTQAIESAKV